MDHLAKSKQYKIRIPHTILHQPNPLLKIHMPHITLHQPNLLLKPMDPNELETWESSPLLPEAPSDEP